MDKWMNLSLSSHRTVGKILFISDISDFMHPGSVTSESENFRSKSRGRSDTKIQNVSLLDIVSDDFD
jgi:hypothetical protein